MKLLAQLFDFAPGPAFQSTDLVRLLPLAGLLVAPVVATLYLRRKALGASGADPQGVWISFIRTQDRINAVFWLAWLVAIPLCDANAVVLAGLKGLPSVALVVGEAAFFLGPPLFIVIGCKWLSYPVYARVRGLLWTRGELLRQAVWGPLVWLAPLILAIAGLGAMTQGDLRQAGALLLGTLVVFVVCRRQLLRAYGWNMRLLSTGDLRQRITALAQMAGAPLRQVYVLPAGKTQMANAFALQANDIWLTDYLLKHLDRREVDAIVAHELAHLQRQHLAARSRQRWDQNPLAMVVWLVMVIGFVSLLYLQESGQPISTRWLPLFPAVVLLGFFAMRSGRKRAFEEEADADAVRLTGDPEALITALAKLARLNWAPLRQGFLAERLASHPGTQRRVETIAYRAGISRERLQELMKVSETETDSYPLPPEVAGDELLFSTSLKQYIYSRNYCLMFAVQCVVPVLTAAFLVPLAEDDTTAWVVALAAAAVAAVAHEVLINYVSVDFYIGLRRRWRELLDQEGWPTEKQRFVDFAPGPTRALYDGFFGWDLGSLFLPGDRLVYVGERTRFALHRDQVTDIWLGPGMPYWLPLRRLYISWHDSASGASGTFSLWPKEVRFLWQLRPATARLAERLREWKRGTQPVDSTSVPENLGLPETGAVASTTFAEARRAKAFYQVLFVTLLLTALVALMFGLPIEGPLPESVWYPLAVAGLLIVVRMAPYWCDRE
jgi:heat shock protein HtpX